MTDSTEARHEDALRELLSGVVLSDAQIQAHLDRAPSRDYWKKLAPDLSVGEPPSAEFSAAAVLEHQVRREHIRRFHDDGYLRVEGIVPAGLVARMRAGVQRVTAADWPAVFTWLYDEFWRVPRMPPLVGLFSDILGEKYRQTPYVWTHLVPAGRGSGGWRAHVDNSGPDRRLTVWIPLTDATHDTGGMFVVPRDMVSRDLVSQWRERSSLSMDEVQSILQATRPLDCKAGGVLAWDARLIHWGSAPQVAGAPRISFSMEFIGADGNPDVVVRSLAGWDGPLPTHEERLRMVATAISLFASKEPRALRYLGLAHRLMEG